MRYTNLKFNGDELGRMNKACIITGGTARESLLKYSHADECSICCAYRGVNKSRLLAVSMLLWARMKIPMKTVWYSHKILKYSKTLIILDDGITLQYLRWLKTNCNADRLIFYYWNTYREGKLHPDDIKKLGYEVWSYDEEDSLRYCMKYNPQMFFKSWYDEIKADQIEAGYDVVFVGRDKFGRMMEMQKIIDLFERQKISYHMYYVAKKWYQRFNSRAYAKYLDFQDMIREELKGKVILDFCVSAQSGFTLRLYDALCNHRKVITNNVKVKQLPFYSKENIFIWGEDDEELLANFIRSEFQPIGKEILEQYSVRGWLERFLRGMDND